jgi:AbrB family looped-hinge helix DNA binding protein
MIEHAKVSSKGLVIPAAFRKRLGIKRGTQVAVTEQNGALLVPPLTATFIRSLRGSLALAYRVLMEERRRERDL